LPSLRLTAAVGESGTEADTDEDQEGGVRYRVPLSTDGVTWKTAWSTTAGDGGLDTARFAGTPARYVRVTATERGTMWGYSLHEVGVHGG
jgi:hypothetical protein